MTMLPPPTEPDDFEPGEIAAMIAVCQCILIALLTVALVVLTPVAHPEWFNPRDAISQSH
jgi:hypothetical protein